jgi:hypothetical protein
MKIMLFLFSISAIAAGTSESVFTIGEQKTTIYNYKEQRVSVSEKCDEILKGHFCENLKFLKDLSGKMKGAKLEKNTGGINPGSNICTSVLEGIVVMGVDPQKNENSFCKLPSGLLIDSGTLTYYSKQ